MIDDGEEYEPAYSAASLKEIGERWLSRILASEKREEAWRKEAEAAETAYLCLTGESAAGTVPDFNILHSNVETIVPAVYNSTPEPNIRPRHDNPDEIAKAGADVLERAIATAIDDDALTTEVEGIAQDSEVAGRGVLRLRFDAQFDAAGMPTDENVAFEVVSWRDYREGAAKRWDAVPWVAFRHCLSLEELNRVTDDDLPNHVDAAGDGDAEEKDQDVWEIWCRETRRVYFVVAETGKVLSITDDPLGLRGFFPCIRPVQPITGTGRRVPVCPYTVYKHLAEELDRITRRINGIMRGLKVKGGVIGDAEGWELLADADDNSLVPIPNMENYAAAGGIANAIVWWPVDQAVAVLQQLYNQRELTKQTIYEVTGISDIVRGASASTETATAQQIKTQWGSLRIKRRQQMIERAVRDAFVLAAEIMARHFSTPGLERMAGMQIAPEVEMLLRDPLHHYRIDVESNSTVRADLTMRRGEMAEFLNGTAQFFGTMAPVVEQFPAAGSPVTNLYAAFARNFNLGKTGEDAIDELAAMAMEQAQQPEQPDPEQQAKQAEIEMKQQQAQADQQFRAMELRLKEAELALKDREVAVKEMQAGVQAEKTEFDAIKETAELELEAEQERGVRIGD